jgi:hypothetical protein
MNFRDDVETEQIGKLIEAGYPDLAASTLRARWRYRWLTQVVGAISIAGVVAWRLFH